MASFDILLEDYDLFIKDGDFVGNVDTEKQHVDLILQTAQGDWRKFPFCGLGIDSFISSPNTEGLLRREATVQLKADGYNVLSITFINDGPDNLKVIPKVERI